MIFGEEQVEAVALHDAVIDVNSHDLSQTYPELDIDVADEQRFVEALDKRLIGLLTTGGREEAYCSEGSRDSRGSMSKTRTGSRWVLRSRWVCRRLSLKRPRSLRA